MTDTSSAVRPTDIPSILGNLRRLLQMPKRERPKEWEAQVSPLIALISVDYPKQEDDRLALAELALVGLADSLGVKEAKRRVRTARVDVPAPSLETLPNLDERKAAAKELARARPTWGLNYSIAALANPESKAYRSEVISLACRGAQSWSEVLKAIHECGMALGDALPVVARGFLDVARSSDSTLSLGESFLEALIGLSGTAKALLADPKKAKLGIATLAVVAEFFDLALSVDPKLVLRPPVGELLAAIDGGKKQPKSHQRYTQEVTLRVVRLLGVVYLHASPEDRDEIRNLARAFSRATPIFTQQVEIAIRRDSALHGLLEKDSQDGAAHSSFPIEEALCSLFPELDELSARFPRDTVVSQIRRRVDAIAAALQVERLFSPGDLVTYDPFSHLLVDESSTLPGRVRVEKPGLVVTRADGSRRVLLKAVVTAIAD